MLGGIIMYDFQFPITENQNSNIEPRGCTDCGNFCSDGCGFLCSWNCTGPCSGCGNACRANGIACMSSCGSRALL